MTGYCPSIVKAFHNAIKTGKDRKWDRIYVFIDVHGTMIKPNYDEHTFTDELYYGAEKVLKFLSDDPFFVLVLYTCSWPKEVEKYLKFFKEKGINFQYVNENPEVKSKAYGCYDQKPYINVLLEDKAGFDPEVDWENIKDYFNSELFKSEHGRTT